MRKTGLKTILALLGGLTITNLATWCPCMAGVQGHGVVNTRELTVETKPGPVVLRVELARTHNAHRQGLKDRHALAPDAGMLFVFDKPKITSMWMVDTYIPLDMLFIDANGVITRIAENTTPLSDALILSATPVKAVLEVNSGTSARLGISPGDRVIHPAIGE